jgi:hypothetical protein
MSGCAAGGLIYSSTVRVPLIKRCVLKHGAKVKSSTVLVHWLWLKAGERPLANSSVYCTVVVVVYCQGVQLRARSTVLR